MHSLSAFSRRFGPVACLVTVLAGGVIHAADEVGRPTAMGANALTGPAVDPLLLDDPAAALQDSPAPSGIFLGDAADAAEAFSAAQKLPSELGEVSLAPSAAMLMDELPLEEMPYQASSGGWFGNGHRYGSAEMLWFSRSRQNRVVIGHDSTTTLTNSENKSGVFATDNIPYNVAPGARLTIGEQLGRDYLDRDRAIEISYYGGFSFFQQNAWNAISNSNRQTYLKTTLHESTPGFTGATQFLQTYNSNFNSLELNYKLNRRLGRDQMVMGPNGAWENHAERGWLPALIVGTRLANESEEFSFSGRVPGQPLSTFSGDYLVQTQNWLLGANLGGELISRNEFYYWGLRGRATPSLAFNANQQQLSAHNIDYQNPTAVPTTKIDGTPRDPFPTGTEVWKMANNAFGPGFVGDLTLLAGWNFTPNSSFQVGYDFLWVAGIATATRQFNLNKIQQNPIDPGGQVFMQGFSFGYNSSW